MSDMLQLVVTHNSFEFQVLSLNFSPSVRTGSNYGNVSKLSRNLKLETILVTTS
jgi:hypothetical protein